MLDINLLRKNFNEVSQQILSRKRTYPQLSMFAEIDSKWRSTTTKLQQLNAQRNALSDSIAKLIKNGRKNEIVTIKKQVQNLKDQIVELEKLEQNLNIELKNIVFSIPNIPDQAVPIGKDEKDNKEIRKWGTPTQFSFKPLPHWELAEKLELADFERAAKLSGSRHTVFKGQGAKLLRALRDFTLDLHVANGYTEIQPPILINPDILYGTGHLPKSEEDMFKLSSNQYLSPTEEVPLTGYYRNEILSYYDLPIKLTSSTISFRSEAGSAGKDVRGVIRQHQFYNTEMVNFSKPEDSMKDLEAMTNECEKVLQTLEIPYRIMLLCTGDMGSAAAKTYDVEVWFPSSESYREISSCSNTNDYQARGSNIKFIRDKQTGFVHTLNGTGTSLNRLWIAIIENCQQIDGTIKIPKALQKYFNKQEYIK